MSVAPTTELELGRNLKPDAIVEGNDVYFECRIRCNPPPHRILWTHEVSSIYLQYDINLNGSRYFLLAPPLKRIDPSVACGTFSIKHSNKKIFHSKKMGILFRFSDPLNRKRILLFQSSHFFSIYTWNKSWNFYFYARLLLSLLALDFLCHEWI